MLRPSPPSRHRGFLLIDLVAGLVIAAIVCGVLWVFVTRIARTNDRLAAQRDAARQLERALVDLSLGRTPPPHITVRPLNPPGQGTDWVEVSLRLSPERELSLIGPARKASP